MVGRPFASRASEVPAISDPSPGQELSLPGRFSFASALDWLLAHLVVALVALVGIGGATRVMQAGLACPDWPLCYGSLLPGRQMNIQVFLEWFHRLDAFLVGIALLVLASVCLLRRALLPRWLPWAAAAALLLVAIQGGLGALTVLGLLQASTVTAHLVTALLLVLLVSAMHQALRRSPSGCLPSASALPQWWTLLLAFSSLVLFGQCALGGAMASRWASSLCLQAGDGCRWLLTHRLGAWVALAALLLPAVLAHLVSGIPPVVRRFSLGPALLVPLQVALGIFTLRLQLQQPIVTVAHQLMAALLVAFLGSLWGITLAARSPTQVVSFTHSLEMAHG